MSVDWDKALCRQEDPNIFFLDRGQSAAEAKAVCLRCPIQLECLAWALATRQSDGVWGALTTDERNSIRRGNEVRSVRECIHCGERFMPLNCNQQCCSKECRKERARIQDRLSRQRRIKQREIVHNRNQYNLGCRCDVCTADHREYQRHWRKQRDERKTG